MRKILFLIICILPVYVSAQPDCRKASNLIFNPGFDMTPWDTGWCKDSTSSDYASQYANASANAVVMPSIPGFSSPKCCSLLADAETSGGSGQSGVPANATATASASIYQTFDPVSNYLFKASIKYYCNCSNEWQENSSAVILFTNTGNDTIRRFWGGSNNWVEVCTTIVAPKTVSGVEFVVYANAYGGSMGAGWWSFAVNALWIDDVQLTEIGVEESNSPQITNSKPQLVISKNVIHCSLPFTIGNLRIAIFDLCGRLKETLHSGSLKAGSYIFEPKIRASGVYFVKLNAGNYNESKKLILLK